MAQKVDNFPNEAKVIIKPEAYLKMLKHVLMYGNSYLPESVEVMGICYGKKEGDTLVQYDAVPITHGNAIEVQFSPEDYAAFALADEEMAKKGYYAIGWYHSHPGLKAFMSKTDIRNHLGWQTDHNPDAYAIVFDHTYFESDNPKLKWGFQAFRLDDYKKGMESDYHEITDKVTVELPDDTSFYNEISAIIEAIQRKEPLIKEARELMAGQELGVWEEKSETPEEEEEIPKESIGILKESVNEGMKAIQNLFMLPIIDELAKFLGETKFAVLKGPSLMGDSLGDMRDAIGAGLTRMKSYFEETLEKEIEEVSKSIEDEIREFGIKQMEVPKKLTEFTSNLSEKLGEIISEQLNLSLREFIGKLREITQSVNSLAQKQSNFIDILNSQDEVISQFPTMVDQESEKLSANINTLPRKINELISKRMDSFKISLSDLKETTQELKNVLDELTKVVMSKRK